MIRSVLPPGRVHEEVYSTCVTQYRTEDERTRLDQLRAALVGQGNLYQELGQVGAAHNLVSILYSEPDADLLQRMYEKRLVASRGICRDVYEELRSGASICPYCGFGEVGTLDHFLAKTSYPELSVCPLNLVPSCHRCNHLKGSIGPEDGQYFINPYFDQLPTNRRWLQGRIGRVSAGPVLAFSIDAEILENNIAGRLAFHFRELKLSRRYQERASELLVEMQEFIELHLQQFGSNVISEYFAGEAARLGRRNLNAMESVAYLAASLDAEFCEGAFVN